MKNIYRLLVVTLFSLCTYFLQAQNIDTISLQKSANGKIKFAHVSNAKIADAANFFKNTLQTTDGDSFVLMKESKDELGMTHQRYQQYYKGIKVENAEYMLHGKNGNIETINGDYQIVNIASVTPALSEQQALANALSYVNAKEYKWQDSASENFIKQINNDPKATYYPKGELVIEKDYLKGGKNLLLSWKFSISSLSPNNVQLIYVDANTGEIINTTPQILDANTPLTAQTLYSGTLGITGDSYSNGYRLREVRNGVTIQTLNLQNTTNTANAIDFTNANTNFTNGDWADFAQDQQALDAHWGAENVLDFWRTTFNRNSLDGNGIRILGYVHYDIDWDNAQWVLGNNNHYMRYGDGDGIIFNPFTALDISAHEMGHGIDEFTANLTPGNTESGALNEGFSDIWGASVEHWAAPAKQTWLIGEEIFIGGVFDCIRNLQNPKDNLAAEGPHPNTYQGQYWDPNGEPHTNSTILRHWFYLLSQGGSGTNDNGNAYDIAGISINEAQLIAWRTESVYLTSSSAYSDARTESILAAQDLYGVGSCEEIAVTNAWYAVGVGAQYVGPWIISGDDIICSSAVYSITPSLNSSASVTWSINPDYSVFQLNPNTPAANQLTIVNNGWYGVGTTLSALINTGCGSTQTVTVTKSINNYPLPPSYTYHQDECLCYNVSYPQQNGTVLTNGTPVFVYKCCRVYIDLGTLTKDEVLLTSGTPSYINWDVQPTTYGQNTLWFELLNGSGGIPFIFSLGGSSSCNKFLFFSQGQSGNYSLTACPNPATSTINVSIINNNIQSSNLSDNTTTTSTSNETISAQSLISNTTGITNMYLYDFYTDQLIKKWSYQENSSSTYSLNVSGVKRGIYVLKMDMDNISAITKIILQ